MTESQQSERLQQAESTLRMLWRAVEQSADLVVVTDREGHIQFVNPAFERLTGYSREEVIGKTPRILKSGEVPTETYRELWKTIVSGNVFRGVVANRRKNGEIIYVEKTITPVKDADGNISHFISSDRDITARRQLEAQLQQAQKMDAIGRLAGGVAHDFNNLLMVISAYAELTLDELPGDGRLHGNVKEILMAARRAADLARQLLAFSRKQLQTLQVLNLNDVIRDIARMLPRLIGEDIQLKIASADGLHSLKADRGQLEQILMNLAANARDAMPHGGQLTIETQNVHLDEAYRQRHNIVDAGNYVMLAVSDSGVGIAPQDLPHIFEPFYTTKAEGKGTGLGLATVYGVVKQNGGFIWVYSEPGMGTTFKIYLPAHGARAAAGAKKNGLERFQGGSETILLVEDEAAVRHSAREFLTKLGYTVLEAADGQDALRTAREFPGPIHLMLTDVVMPHMGGAQLADRIAADRPQTKVLFVSGYAESVVSQHGAVHVLDRFLAKPFSLSDLAKKLREVLDHCKSLGAASGQ